MFPIHIFSAIDNNVPHPENTHADQIDVVKLLIASDIATIPS